MIGEGGGCVCVSVQSSAFLLLHHQYTHPNSKLHNKQHYPNSKHPNSKHPNSTLHNKQ